MNLPKLKTKKGSCNNKEEIKKKEEDNIIDIRACGAMETRQTTDLKIAGSTPAGLVFFNSL